MARVRIELPSLLAPFASGSSLDVEAETLRGSLDALIAACPALEVHLFDEGGRFRRHVLCFHNGTNTRWLDDLERPVADGDAIRLMQAVSGG